MQVWSPIWIKVHGPSPLRGSGPLRTGWTLLLIFLLCWLPTAQAQKTFSNRYSNTAVSGDIVLIGNTNYYCSLLSPATAAQITACNSARSGSASIRNNDVYMVPIDTDSDASTTNSSSATLSLASGSNVLFAGLYWNGISSSAANRSTVSFAPPSGVYTTLTATAANIAVVGSTYQSFVDVTSTVQAGGNGVYSVGNVASTTGAGNWGGWTMVVAYKNTSLPTRNLTVFDGIQQGNNSATPVDISVSGFITPATGTVKSTIGVVAYDGDAGQLEGAGAGGSLQFGATSGSLSAVYNTVNPVNDVFNSTISNTTGVAGGGSNVTAGRNPSYIDTLGLDIDTLTPNTALPNGSTSAVVRVVGSSGDTIYPGIITLATDIFVPNIKDSLTKTVTDVNGGAVVPGDVLEYELVVKNSGNDGASGVVLQDPLPSNVTYLPGSLVVTGINAGSKTDAAGDDQAEYAASSRTVTARLGTGATASAGGLVAPGDETHLRFRVTVNAGVPGGTTIDNTGTVNYKQQTLGTAVTDTSDSDPNTAGDQPARVTVAGPDLTVTKTHTGNAAEGGLASFTLHVANAGQAPTFGTVTLADTLPAGLSAVGISGSGWTCGLSPLQCTRSDVLAAGSSYPDVTLQVRTSALGSLTNTANVSSASEGSVNTGNDTASDTLTVQPKPSVALTKTVRNVTAGGTAGTAASARPGQTLEYCVGFSNQGGDAPNFVVQDNAPANTTALPNAYGSGLAAQLTLGGQTTLLTGAADSDAATLSAAGNLTYTHGTLTLGQSGSVCFQVMVN